MAVATIVGPISCFDPDARLAQRDPFPREPGQTAAMAAGAAAARGELIAFLDADLQNDPHDLAKLIEPIVAGRADVVCGWRARRQDNPVTRTLPSVVANFVIRKSLGLRIHDIGCTSRCFVENTRGLAPRRRNASVHSILRVGAGRAHRRGRRPPPSRQHGQSKYGFGRVGKVLMDLLTVKILNTYGSSPAYFFGKIALVFSLLGSAAFAVVAYRVLVLHSVQSTPLIFIMLLLFITALLALMSGLLAEINIRVLHQVGGRAPYKIIDQIGFNHADHLNRG